LIWHGGELQSTVIGIRILVVRSGTPVSLLLSSAALPSLTGIW
jgi:hypothetical protein